MNVDALLKDCKVLQEEQSSHLRKMMTDVLFMHRNMKAAFDRLFELIKLGKPGQLVALVGPTHTGKTTLVKTMDKMLIAEAKAKGLPTWGSAYCRLPSPVHARFDDGETYRRTLEALEEPLVDRKVLYPDIRQGAVPRRALPRTGRNTTHQAMLKVLVSRLDGAHEAVFFDEAGELPQSLKVVSRREAVNFFKQLADLGKSCAVLVSGPEIGPMIWEYAQTMARTKIIGLDPYYSDNEEDRKIFRQLFKQIEGKLGADYIVPGTVSTANNALFLMVKTRGTVGIAMDIIVDASHSSLVKGLGPLDWKHLEGAIEQRMRDIGTPLDLEIALWEAVKKEELRRDYWGDSWAGANGCSPLVSRGKSDSLIRTGARGQMRSTKAEPSLDRDGVPSKSTSELPKAAPAKRSLIPKRPKRTALGTYEADMNDAFEALVKST
ncbi:AAA family ATPase [Burkholderia vietnamiensis]|uniref:AAA family ATPase n=1 Tax=Burkholderia vietnamiensis TaxID=60552 RepID=UPI00076BD168|nr:AAA family ATPase [Burkholderia vietnamiensis]KVF31160.1 hypothetical protein WJ09_19325 [Burkholderia vietnamiensis]